MGAEHEVSNKQERLHGVVHITGIQFSVLGETRITRRHAPCDGRPAIRGARARAGMEPKVDELDPAIHDGNVPEEGREAVETEVAVRLHRLRQRDVAKRPGAGALLLLLPRQV